MLAQQTMGKVSSGLNSVLSSIDEHNLELKSLRCEQEALVLEAKGDNVLAGPSVEYSPFYKDGYNGLAESELVVSEEFDFPTKYVARNKQSRLQKQAGDYRYQAARREILLEAQLVCFEVIHINQSLQMLNRRLEGTESLYRMFQKRMETGDANILELNKVKMDKMEVLSQLNEKQNERFRLLGRLQELNAGVALELPDTLYPARTMDLDFSAFLQRALASDAGILVAEANLRAQEHAVSMSRMEWLPSLTMGYRRNTEGSEAVNGFVVGASFPILWSGQKSKAARQRQLSMELQLVDARQMAQTSLETSYRELEGLQRVLDDFDVDMMYQMLDLLDKALQHGQISALQFYSEIDSIYEKLESHLTLRCKAAQLHAQLYRWTL